jgi:hypothetical protein
MLEPAEANKLEIFNPEAGGMYNYHWILRLDMGRVILFITSHSNPNKQVFVLRLWYIA